MKKIAFVFTLVVSISLVVSSCSPVITPYQAANGKHKCGASLH
ncbi:MAG: hypothetical protein ACK50E_02010 [Bacteroidota bacterium]